MGATGLRFPLNEGGCPADLAESILRRTCASMPRAVPPTSAVLQWLYAAACRALLASIMSAVGSRPALLDNLRMRSTPGVPPLASALVLLYRSFLEPLRPWPFPMSEQALCPKMTGPPCFFTGCTSAVFGLLAVATLRMAFGLVPACL
jgi:hypothetical protein